MMEPQIGNETAIETGVIERDWYRDRMSGSEDVEWDFRRVDIAIPAQGLCIDSCPCSSSF